MNKFASKTVMPRTLNFSKGPYFTSPINFLTKFLNTIRHFADVLGLLRHSKNKCLSVETKYVDGLILFFLRIKH